MKALNPSLLFFISTITWVKYQNKFYFQNLMVSNKNPVKYLTLEVHLLQILSARI